MKYDARSFKKLQAKRLANGKGQIHKPSRKTNKAVFTRARLAMTESIKDLIAKTRIDLFGNAEPPFKDIETMGEWLIKEDQSQPPPEGHAPRYGYMMPEGISPEDLKKLYEEKPGIYGTEIATLSYPGGDGWQRVVRVSDGTRLRRLWLAVRHIAKELDCQEAQATGLILTGKLPLVSALTATTHPTINTDKPNRGKIEITIREPISEGELKNVYRNLRKALWGNIKHKPASDLDCALVEFVNEKRNEPEWDSWESVRQAWNDEYPDWAYQEISGWRGFRKKFEDAWKKIYPDIHWGDVNLAN